MLPHAPTADNESLQPLTPGLPDAPTIENEAAHDRRAALACAADTFDPLGLYALEQERDAAAALLAASIPVDYSIGLSHIASIHRHPGLGFNRTSEWSAVVLLPNPTGLLVPPSIGRRAASPTEAVDALLAAWRERHAAQAPAAARSKETYFGTIDPATAPT